MISLPYGSMAIPMSHYLQVSAHFVCSSIFVEHTAFQTLSPIRTCLGQFKGSYSKSQHNLFLLPSQQSPVNVHRSDIHCNRLVLPLLFPATNLASFPLHSPPHQPHNPQPESESSNCYATATFLQVVWSSTSSLSQLPSYPYSRTTMRSGPCSVQRLYRYGGRGRRW